MSQNYCFIPRFPSLCAKIFPHKLGSLETRLPKLYELLTSFSASKNQDKCINPWTHAAWTKVHISGQSRESLEYWRVCKGTKYRIWKPDCSCLHVYCCMLCEACICSVSIILSTNIAAELYDSVQSGQTHTATYDTFITCMHWNISTIPS